MQLSTSDTNALNMNTNLAATESADNTLASPRVRDKAGVVAPSHPRLNRSLPVS